MNSVRPWADPQQAGDDPRARALMLAYGGDGFEVGVVYEERTATYEERLADLYEDGLQVDLDGAARRAEALLDGLQP